MHKHTEKPMDIPTYRLNGLRDQLSENHGLRAWQLLWFCTVGTETGTDWRLVTYLGYAQYV